ncbi:MAG: hypothetical protein NW241_21295 [Bacteroidia bacterium]|nr:hypothetical protein [Bacteroidia bacterium]
MELIAEVLKYAVPALLVLLGVKLVLDDRLRQSKEQQTAAVRGEMLRSHLPAKLHAYERAVLLMERMRFGNLLLRLPAAGMPASAYYELLLGEIRSEFDHNLAQQLYISPAAWQVISQAREEAVGVIHAAYRSLPEGAEGMQLARAIVGMTKDLPEQTTQKAILMLKEDVQKLFPFPVANPDGGVSR